MLSVVDYLKLWKLVKVCLVENHSWCASGQWFHNKLLLKMHEHSGVLSLQIYRLVGLNLLCLRDFPCHLMVWSLLLVGFSIQLLPHKQWSAGTFSLLCLKHPELQVLQFPSCNSCTVCLQLLSPPQLFPQQQLWHLGNCVLLGCAAHLIEKLLLFK